MKKIYLSILTTYLTCFSISLPAQTPIFNNNGALITVKSGASAIVFVDGSLDNMANGTLNNAGHIITNQDYRNNGTTTGVGATGLFEVKGNWENNSTFTAGQSTVLLNKIGNVPPFQQITGTQISSFYDLSLDGNNVKRQTLDAITTNNLDIKDCELRLDVNKMTMTKTANAALSYTTGMISARGNGQFAREMINTGGFYWFPTGDSVEGTYRFRPIQLNPNASGQFGVRMANVDASTETFNRNTREFDICNVNPNFYHRLYRNTGNANADIRYYYLSAVDGLWERVGHWDGTPQQWQKMPAPVNNTSGGFDIMAYNGWTDFSPTPFALISLLPLIDTANVIINPEYCGPTGFVHNLSVSNTMPGTIYSWTNANTNAVIPGANTPQLNNVTTGLYTLHVEKPNGCDAVMTFAVGFVPTFTTDIVGKNLDCYKDKTGAADLTVTGGFPQFTYNWSNGTHNQDLSNANAGWQYVTVIDSKGCKVKDSVLLTEPTKLVATFDSNPETCDMVNGSIEVYPSGGTPGYSYSWDPSVSNTFMATNLLAGDYFVMVTDSNGCKVSKLVTVKGIPLPTTVFTAEPGVNIEVLVSNATFTFENQTQGAVSYLWDFGDGNTSTLKNPTHTYAEPGQYFVTLTSYNTMGCSTIYTLSPLLVIPDGSVYIPNAFTPNGDGTNDVFGVYGEGIVKMNMTIFDRWGKEIVTFTNPADRWNGVAHGKDAPEGAYTYHLEATLNNGKILTRAGTVLIIR